MTVSQWLDIWTAEYLGGVKPRTVESYNATVKNHIKPAIGATKLESLTVHQLQKMLNDLERGSANKKPMSAKTIKNVHGVIHRALQQAVAVGHIRYNPANACILPHIEKPDIKPLDDQAIGDFLKEIRGHNLEQVFLVTLFTGLRRSEVLGLKWDCVDLNNGTLTIKRQLQKIPNVHNEYQLLSPKNGKGRTITAAPTVVQALRSQKITQTEQRLKAGPLWNEAGFVFTDDTGHFIPPHVLYRSFKSIAASIGHPDARFHDLRHTYAVSSLRAGDDIKTVQANLGHHAAAFTLDIYGHVTEKMKQDSANRMEQFIKYVSSQ